MAELIHLEPRTGSAFKIKKDQILKIIDPEGQQVADLTAFAADDVSEWLSSGRSIDYANTIYLTTGHILYSNRSRPMFTIMADDVGRHDFLLTPCSPQTFEILYDNHIHEASCFENICKNVERFGIKPDQVSTTFNVFMNVRVGQDGELSIEAPLSKAGDFLLLKAEMDLIVAVTACSAPMSNNGTFKPIDIEVLA